MNQNDLVIITTSSKYDELQSHLEEGKVRVKNCPSFEEQLSAEKEADYLIAYVMLTVTEIAS